MANKQTLPNTQRFQESYIQTKGAPLIPSISYNSPLRGVADVVDKADKFMGDYTKLRYEGYEAQGTKLMADMAHAMEDAKDPCELEDIRKQYESQLNTIGGDDFFGKSYRKSRYFNSFKDKWQLNAEKMYLNKMHDFEEIAATANAQEIANAISESENPDDIMAAVNTYNASLAGITHLTADKKYNLMNGMLKTVMGNTAALNPNTADAIVDKYGDELGKYGLDTADIKIKTEARRKAMRSEARAEAAQRRAEVKEARDSMLANLQAKILMNPNQADQIISEASTVDDKLFVSLSDWNRKRVGKNNESPYKQDFLNHIRSSEGTPQEKVKSFYEENPEALFDSGSRSAIDQYLQINPKGESSKEEDEILSEARKAAETKEGWTKYAEDNFIDLASYSKTRTFRDDINKKYGIVNEKYVDSIINEIKSNPDFTQQDIDRMRISTQDDELLSQADKNKVHDELDKKQTILERREEKEEKAQEKVRKEQTAAQKEVDKQNSAKALNEVRNATTSSEADNIIAQNRGVLNETDKGKALTIRNSLRKDEAKAQNKTEEQLRKERHDKNFLDMQSNIDSLTQAEIDSAADDDMISYSQARNLTKQIQKNRDKNVEQLKKDKISEEKILVAKNALNNEVTDPETLTTAAGKEYALNQMPKVYDNKYVAKLSEIKNTAFSKGDMTEDEQRKAVNELNALNVLGKHAPEEEVARIAKDCRTDLLKNLRTNINAWIPIRGSKANAIELKAREDAYNELATMAQESKRPLTTAEIKSICDKYRPKSEDYVQDIDEAYYGLLAQKGSLFVDVKQTGESDYNGKESRKTVDLTSTATFNQFDDYMQNVTNNYKAGKITQKQYQELYKPIAMYMGEIVNRAYKYDTVEAYAMRRVLETFNGGKTDNATDVYEIYRDVMNTLEQQDFERTGGTGFWSFGAKGKIDKIVEERIKNSQQLNGYSER